MSFFNELKRRNVFRAATAYVVAAWLIIQVIETIFPAFGFDDSAVRIAVIMLTVGFLPVVILAWAFELTPDGLKQEKEVDYSSPTFKQFGKRIDRLIMVVLAIAVAYFLFDELFIEARQDAGTERSSIAILPFANRSDREEDAFFSDGMHDDLLTSLAKIAALKVISRTSVMRYRDSDTPIPEIAKELGVGVILEGGVQRSADQIRVNVQLIDAKTDVHLWAEIFDRKLTAENLFAIQSEITNEIVESLRIVLSDQESESLSKAPTNSIEAYNAYVLGRSEITSSRTPIALRRAEAHFNKALEYDPDYALAWVGLADAVLLQVIYANRDREASFASTRKAVERALGLDPLLGDACATLAELESLQQNNDEAEAHYLKAIELSPNSAKGYHWLGVFYRNMNRLDEASRFLQQAISINPLDPTPKAALTLTYRQMGLDEKAYAVSLEGVKQNPQFTLFYGHQAWIERTNGNMAKAAQWIRAGIKLGLAGPFFKTMQCDLYLQLGDDPSAEQCFDQLEESFPQRYIDRASLYWFRQQYDDLVEIMQRQVEDVPAARFDLAHAYILAGDIAQSRQILQELAPELYGNEVLTISSEYNELLKVLLAAITLLEDGQDERAHYLLDLGLSTMHSLPYAGLFKYKGAMGSFYHAVRGDNQKAIAAMREAINSGWRKEWWQARDGSVFYELEQEPGWVELMTELEADIAKQRQWYENHKDERPF